MLRFLLTGLMLAITTPAQAQDLVTVFVARQDIPRGTLIQDPDKLFKRVRYAKGDEPKDAVTDLEKIKGQTLLVALAEDQPLKVKFLGKDEKDILPLVPPGHRAITFRAELDNAVAGFIMPGSRVDVLWTMTKDGKTETKVVETDLLLLAVTVTGKDKPVQVTLAVKPEQAEKLYFVASRANLPTLVLRKPDGK